MNINMIVIIYTLFEEYYWPPQKSALTFAKAAKKSVRGSDPAQLRTQEDQRISKTEGNIGKCIEINAAGSYGTFTQFWMQCSQFIQSIRFRVIRQTPGGLLEGIISVGRTTCVTSIV